MIFEVIPRQSVLIGVPPPPFSFLPPPHSRPNTEVTLSDRKLTLARHKISRAKYPALRPRQKKVAFTVRKTKIEFTENAAFYKRLSMFYERKIRHFLCVFALVNPSIRSIVR